jgi:hypothetical protein
MCFTYNIYFRCGHLSNTNQDPCGYYQAGQPCIEVIKDTQMQVKCRGCQSLCFILPDPPEGADTSDK